MASTTKTQPKPLPKSGLTGSVLFVPMRVIEADAFYATVE